MDGSKSAKKPTKSGSGSPSRGGGEVSDASYRSRSLSGGGRSQSAGSRSASRSQGKPKPKSKIRVDSSDDDFVSSGTNTYTRSTRSKAKKKSEMDAKNSAQNPGAMAANPEDLPLIQNPSLSYASVTRSGSRVRPASQAGQGTSSTQIPQNSQIPNSNPNTGPSPSGQGQVQILESSQAHFQESHVPITSGLSEYPPLDASASELITSPIPGPSGKATDASHGVVTTSPGPSAQSAKGSYLDRSGNRPSPYQRPPGPNNAKGGADKVIKEIKEAEEFLDSLSPQSKRQLSPPQHSSSPIHPGEVSPGGASGYANEEVNDPNLSAATILLDLNDHLLTFLDVPARQNYPGSPRCQPFGGLPSDPSVGPGHHHQLAVKSTT